MLLFGNLLWAPFNGLLDIAEAIDDAARRELEDPEIIQAKLLELQFLYELGEIDEAEYQSGYQELAERLLATQHSGHADDDEEDEEDEDEEEDIDENEIEED